MTAPLSPQQREFIITATEILKARYRNQRRRLFFQMFPDEDMVLEDGSKLHARAGYTKHIEFFEAGSKYRERCFMAANRVGKSIASAYEMTAHLTGHYPDWWKGKTFKRGIRAWAAGKTDETTRDTLQEALMGEVEHVGSRKLVSGTGLIPGQMIGPISWKQGSPNLIDTVKIRHKSGGWSKLGFKSYARGRGSFEGTAQHVIALDEECPSDIYGECLMRTATTNGIVMLTFTPLDGLTETVLQFMPEDLRPGAG